MSYRLNAEESIEQGIRRVATEQIEAALAELDDPQMDRDESIHQVRKRCKKLRALVRLVRPVFDGYRSENAWFRDAARSLSGLRDAESSLESLEKLLEHYRDQLDMEAFAGLVEELKQGREQLATQEVDLDERLAALASGMQQARNRVRDWTLDTDGFDALEEGLLKTYRRGRKAMNAAYKNPSPEQFHEWRKRVKYHWYHVRLLRAVWKPLMKKRRETVKELAELLGDDHDLVVLRQLLETEAGRFSDQQAVQVVVSLIDQRRSQLQAEARPLGKRIYAVGPKKIAKRIGKYWKAWKREAVSL